MSQVIRICLLSGVCLLLFACQGYCQLSAERRSIARNSIYGEAATKGSPYTVNVDRIFHVRERVAYTYRLGISYAKEYVTIPVGIGMITGVGDHHLEVDMTVIPYLNMHDAKNDPTNLFIYAIPTIGYRYQHPDGGIFFKVSAGPAMFWNPPQDHAFRVDAKFYAYGSAALGFSF